MQNEKKFRHDEISLRPQRGMLEGVLIRLSALMTVMIIAGAMLLSTASSVDTTGNTAISGYVVDKLTIQAPAGVSGGSWRIDPDTTANNLPTDAQSLYVRTNLKSWQVKIKDIKSANPGYLTKFTPSTANPPGAYDTDVKLSSALGVAAALAPGLSSTDFTCNTITSLSGTDQILIDGRAKTSSTSPGSGFPITFSQAGSWNDDVLSSNSYYKIEIQFTGSYTI